MQNHVKQLLLKKQLDTGDTISVSDIVEATGLSDQVIRNWRDNKVHRFDEKTIEAFMDYFEIESLDDLLYRVKGKTKQ